MAKTILVVEDYEDVRRLMKVLINLHGYEVIEAANGREALEQAEKHHPDLILMDLAMPHISGFAATQNIRRADKCEMIPIIALTAHGDFYKNALESGCNEVIRKPIDFKLLAPLIDQYLEAE